MWLMNALVVVLLAFKHLYKSLKACYIKRKNKKMQEAKQKKAKEESVISPFKSKQKSHLESILENAEENESDGDD